MKNPVFPVKDAEFKSVKGKFKGTLSEINKGSEFVDRLCRLRKKSKLSQKELADKLGVSKSTVSYWENGDTIPDAKAIYSLSRIYGVPTDYILCTSYLNQELTPEIRVLVDSLGFSQKAAREICVLSIPSNGEWARSRFEAFNALIEQTSEFEAILRGLYECMHFYQTITPLEVALKEGSFRDEVIMLSANADNYIRTDRAMYKSATTYNPQYWVRVVAERFLKNSEKQKAASSETAEGGE